MDKEKIMICDDEEGVRESLGLILADKYNVICAKSGEELIKKVKAMPDIKLILLDIKMPGKNGLDLLSDIKSSNNDIRTIIVTGYQSVETAAEAIKAGAINYIVKPFESEHVLEVVEKALL